MNFSSLYAIARPSVVCHYLSSVTLGRPTQAVQIFGNISRHMVHWLSTDIQIKFYGDRPRVVVKYSDFGLSKAIPWKRCKTGDKLLLITRRKS